MKGTVFTGVLAALLAAVGAYMRELIVPVIVLLCVMVADYITGMARAWITKTLSSRVGVRGIVKKLAYMFAVAVGIVVDWIIQSAGQKAGLELGSFYFVGLLVTVWLILNECISILENVSEIGAPVPGFLLKLIGKLKKTAEEKGDEAAASPFPELPEDPFAGDPDLPVLTEDWGQDDP